MQGILGQVARFKKDASADRSRAKGASKVMAVDVDVTSSHCGIRYMIPLGHGNEKRTVEISVRQVAQTSSVHR